VPRVNQANPNKRETDNASLPTKLALREWLLRRMKLTDVYVLDACAGAGHVWRAMEDRVNIRQWTKCDLKPRSNGTLAMSAVQAMRSLPVDTFNVIDIDPYGEPWTAYSAFLNRDAITQPTAVFLTYGHLRFSVVTNETLDMIGLPRDWYIPRTPAMATFCAERSLQVTHRHARIRCAARVHLPRVSYYALGLDPLK
jgi:hypothetical protein